MHELLGQKFAYAGAQHGTTIGPSAEGRDFLPIDDQARTLAADVEAVRTCPMIAPGVVVAGFVYDVDSGLLDAVV